MLEGVESDDSKNLAIVSMMPKLRDGLKDALAPNKRASDVTLEEPGLRVRPSEGIIGSSRLSEFDFPSLNSSRLGSLSSACARRVARSAATLAAHVCPRCSQFRWYWWPLACAEVHQLLPGQFVVGHG